MGVVVEACPDITGNSRRRAKARRRAPSSLSTLRYSW